MFWRRIQHILNISKYFGVGNALSGVSQHQLAPEMPYPGPSERICPRRRVLSGFSRTSGTRKRTIPGPSASVSLPPARRLRPGGVQRKSPAALPYGFIHTALQVQEADFCLICGAFRIELMNIQELQAVYESHSNTKAFAALCEKASARTIYLEGLCASAAPLFLSSFIRRKPGLHRLHPQRPRGGGLLLPRSDADKRRHGRALLPVRLPPRHQIRAEGFRQRNPAHRGAEPPGQGGVARLHRHLSRGAGREGRLDAGPVGTDAAAGDGWEV